MNAAREACYNMARPDNAPDRATCFTLSVPLRISEKGPRFPSLPIRTCQRKSLLANTRTVFESNPGAAFSKRDV
jgi:hypothetical protein